MGPIHTSELILYLNCTKGPDQDSRLSSGRLSPIILVALFRSGLGPMPGDLEKDRKAPSNSEFGLHLMGRRD